MTYNLAPELRSTAVPPSAVGRDKARYLAARLLIPPVVTVPATFTAHGGRPQGHFPSFPAADIDQDALAEHAPGSYFEVPRERWPFALWPVLPPPRWDVTPTTPMATLTADTDLGGFEAGFPSPSLALLPSPCRLSHVPSDGLHGIVSGVVIGPTSPRLSRLPSGRGVPQVPPRHPVAAPEPEAAAER